MPETMSSRRSVLPYQPRIVTRCHGVAGSASRSLKLGRRAPLSGDRPLLPGRRGGGGWYRRASRRRRVITLKCALTSRSRSMTEKLLSATAITCRPGSQRAVCSSAWRAWSVSFLCRFPWLCAARSDGDRTVRNGSAQTQPAQGIGASSMTQSQRRPLTLTGPQGQRRRRLLTVAGGHRIAVDAAHPDLPAPAAFDGVVDGDDDRPVRHEGDDEQKQELTRGKACRPAGRAQDTMVDSKACGLIQAHDAQRRRDGAPARAQHGAGDQHGDVDPGRGGEAADERPQPLDQDPTRIRGTVSAMIDLLSGLLTPAEQPRPAEEITM